MRNLILFLLLLPTIALTQSSERIVPFYNNGKWGFMNKNKDIIICPKYEEAYPTSHEPIRVKFKGKYGYINHKGKLIIKAKYEKATDFKRGRARVTRKGKTYTIDKTGSRNDKPFIIIACPTHDCLYSYFNSNRVTILKENGKVGMIYNRQTKQGKKTITVRDTILPVFDAIHPITHELMYFIKDTLIAIGNRYNVDLDDFSNPDVLRFKYEDIQLFDCTHCREGQSNVIGVKQNGLWGYVKTHNKTKEFIKPKYLSITSLESGFALVEYAKNKFGYIDYQGNEYFFR